MRSFNHAGSGLKMGITMACCVLAAMALVVIREGGSNTNIRRRLTTTHHQQHLNTRVIPKIIHQIYLGFDSKRQHKPNLPERLLKWREHCKLVNSDYEIQFWSKRRLEHLIQTKYSYLWETWHSWDSEWIKQADAARYIVLNEFGGIYMDIDYSCRRPMDALIADEATIVLHRGVPGGESVEYIDNSWMASTPHHWFWSNVLAELAPRAHLNVLEATGPHLLHKVLYDVCGTKPEIKFDPNNRTYYAPDVEKYGIVLTTASMGDVVWHHHTGTWLGLYSNDY